jgi:hypothetical protein
LLSFTFLLEGRRSFWRFNWATGAAGDGDHDTP